MTATATATVTETVEPSPESSELTVTGDFSMLYGLSEEIMTGGPTCDPNGVDIKVRTGTGEVVALADIGPAKPTRVKPGAGFTTWTCASRYTATVDADSEVFTFEASLAGLPQYGTYEKTLSRTEMTAGEAPYLMITFAPSLN